MFTIATFPTRRPAHTINTMVFETLDGCRKKISIKALDLGCT